MPVLSWGHSQYWQTQTPEAPVVAGASGASGYPPFQTTVLFGSMFGGLQPVWQWVVTVTKQKDKQ